MHELFPRKVFALQGKLDMRLCNMGTRRQQSQHMAKIFKSYILTPPHPNVYWISVMCEQPKDELSPLVCRGP